MDQPPSDVEDSPAEFKESDKRKLEGLAALINILLAENSVLKKAVESLNIARANHYALINKVDKKTNIEAGPGIQIDERADGSKLIEKEDEILHESSGSKDVYDFDPIISSSGNVSRAGGRRAIIDGAWEVLGPSGILGSGDGFLWMKYQYDGGPWTEGFSSSLPDMDGTCRVFITCEISGGVIRYIERGAKVVMNLVDCDDTQE